jgi:hypothetical protein
MKAGKTVLVSLILTLLFTLLLPGCGGGSVSKMPAPAKLIEPCDLVSKSEAEQFIGKPVKNPEKKETAAVGLKLCIYDSVAEGSGQLLQIGLTQQAFMPGNGQTPKKIYDALKSNFSNAAKIDGIGNEAFIAPPGLHILAGNYYLTVAVGNSNDPKNQELLKTIGKKIVGKL